MANQENNAEFKPGDIVRYSVTTFTMEVLWIGEHEKPGWLFCRMEGSDWVQAFSPDICTKIDESFSQKFKKHTRVLDRIP